MTEKKLVGLLLRGDKKALRFFLKTYQPFLLNFIKRKVAEEDAEEILQDVFLLSLESLRDFAFRAKLTTFLCAIARHKIADYYRKKRLKKILFSQLPAAEPLLKVLRTPEDKLDEVLIKKAIEKSLQLLKPRYQKILRLKYEDGFSVNEIAFKLKISFKSAESHLFRARKIFIATYKN